MSDTPEDTEAKAGAAINRANAARIQAMHDHACAMGAACDAGNAATDYTPIGKSLEALYSELDAVAKAIDAREALHETPASAKGDDIPTADDAAPVFATVKALGDRTLELRVAYGYDAHGERFSAKTDFDIENFPTPPVLYYHGYDEKGKPMGKPVVIGRTTKRESRDDGHYLTAKLKNGQYADKTWDAALKGQAVVSPGTAGHLRRKASDGELTYWPIVEISAWDYAEHRKPAHPHSVAIPVLKALYLAEGLDLPASLSKEQPEAVGDTASAESSSVEQSPADISPDEAAQYIVTQVASAVLAKNMRTT
jgi:hypothetical protein